MKKIKLLALAAMLGMGGLCGCSAGTDADAGDAKGDAQVVEVTGTFTEVPEDYPFIPDDEFQTAFDNFYEKSQDLEATQMTYDDVAEIFGAPGAYYVEQDYNEGEYKYYKWFSDADRDVMITFKGDGMTYFSWTSGTVNPSN